MKTMDEDGADRRLRSDAQVRREALIAAAALCFREQGYRVPLEAVAARAGVGRGTLYRNFKDREALALAIFSREIDRVAALLLPDHAFADTLARVARHSVPTLALFKRISAELLLDDGNRADFRALGCRLERTLQPMIDRGHARGDLAPAISAHDVVLALRMIGGLLLPILSEAEIDDQVSVALRLLLAGMCPR